MKLKVGDKVKFLNQVGGGIVSKVVSSQIVNVTDDTGFDIPTLIKDLIKVEPLEGAGKLFEQDIKVSTPIEQHYQSQPATKEYADNISSLRPVPESRNIDRGLYLAFVPHEQRWLITDDIDVYLVNRTPYTALVSVFLQTDTGYNGVDYSDIPSESKMYVATINRDSIASWSKGVVQTLFHYDGGATVLSPVSADFKIKGSRFYKEESYVETPCIDAKAIVVSLVKLSDVKSVATIEVKASCKDDKDEQPKEHIMVKKAKILFPLSQIGAITQEQRSTINESSRISGKYESAVDRESAFEQIMKQREAAEKEAAQEAARKAEEKAAEKEEKERQKKSSKSRSSSTGKSIFSKVLGTAFTYFAKTVATQLARNLTKKSKK